MRCDCKNKKGLATALFFDTLVKSPRSLGPSHLGARRDSTRDGCVRGSRLGTEIQLGVTSARLISDVGGSLVTLQVTPVL
jgi:hypothetical protein